MEAHRYGRSMQKHSVPSPEITIPRFAGYKSQFTSLTLLKPEKNFFFFRAKRYVICSHPALIQRWLSRSLHIQPIQLSCHFSTQNWSQSISEASSPTPFNKSVNNRCTAPPTFPTAPVPNLLSLSLPGVGSHRVERREPGWKWRKQESERGREIGATGGRGCAEEPGGEGRRGTREQGREEKKDKRKGEN